MSRVFISYSHTDEEYEVKLRAHLASARRIEVKTFSDTLLRPGDHWPSETQRYMDEADAGILLLSCAFMNSECCGAELNSLIAREPPCRLFLVLIESCFWYHDKRLAEINLVNRKPVKESNNPDKALFDVAEKICKTLLEAPSLHRRRAARSTEEQDPWKRIGEAIEQGFFTPVLGPGCYEVTEKTRAAREHLDGRLEWLFQELAGDKNAREFVEGVALSAFKEKLGDRGQVAGAPVDVWMRDLIALQASLAKLGASCCQLLGNAMQERPRGFVDVHSLWAFVGEDPSLPDQPGQSNIRQRFFNVTDLAAELSKRLDSSVQPMRGLGIRGILAQLVMMTYSIFYGEIARENCDNAAREWKKKHRDLVTAAARLVTPPEIPDSTRISVSHVEWLGDLLWHTIRFDAPMYPSPDELAFQLSVCLGTKIPPRKERVGTVAEVADWRIRPALIRNLFRAYEVGSSSRAEDESHFYNTIARALLYEPPPKNAFSSRKGCGGEAVRSQRIKIAISTTFDRELERAFDRMKKTYHIVLPVYVHESEGEDQEHSDWEDDWLFVTITWDEFGQRIPFPGVHLRKGSLDKDDIDLSKRGIREPVIVKLHGSPLETLTNQSCMHRLSISDCDFIEAMISRDRFWPPGLREVLEVNRRVLCFIGYPLTDTRSRMRLSDHLEGENKCTLYLVDSPEDPLRHTLLNNINVILVLNRLEELPGRIESCLTQGSEGYS
ncbi:MAG TPA: toll/interleukin-1 receptor domain-containing protein [Thermoanaerobaculia bacterium]|nr:toll/interleukin-1 receptor domain-containing protein [Thermoanaerobaculia bacterium]